MTIQSWHGECASVFYVVDDSQPDGEQPAIVFSTNTRSAAEAWILGYNHRKDTQ